MQPLATCGDLGLEMWLAQLKNLILIWFKFTFKSHMWLMATRSDSEETEYSYHHRKFYWTAAIQNILEIDVASKGKCSSRQSYDMLKIFLKK